MQGTSFNKFIRAYDQQVPDKVGMIDEIHRLVAHLDIGNVTEFCLSC